ncbi:hypothetical protein HFP51_11835 [Parasphingopyxis sp. CP4]|uniref:hypothetical protein n=1 Tax=Parasphingopyxis sp. CP4 TaxID=2724527 RepID=UPI0015A40D36|nr:hypothetical protein [Parasphingopyxis sp. CP4]QLC22809.1 hypothetical protein HFP51_11835 [Parasphingopyxis sp. CP4]
MTHGAALYSNDRTANSLLLGTGLPKGVYHAALAQFSRRAMPFGEWQNRATGAVI